jgi:hypothetical protein
MAVIFMGGGNIIDQGAAILNFQFKPEITKMLKKFQVTFLHRAWNNSP